MDCPARGDVIGGRAGGLQTTRAGEPNGQRPTAASRSSSLRDALKTLFSRARSAALLGALVNVEVLNLAHLAVLRVDQGLELGKVR